MAFITHWHQDMVDRLTGAPDFLLSLVMLAAAAVIVFAAFKAPPTVKAAILVFIILP